MSPDFDLTQCLHASTSRDAEATDRLFLFVYDELRLLAASHMRRQRANHTLQPTALANEVFLRLVDQTQVDWKNRAHFMAVAAMAMRQILIKHARAKNAAKRGGGWQRITLANAVSKNQESEFDIVALDDALTELSQLSERQSKVIELRFFGGLTIKETAEALGVGTTTVEDDWHAARAWLAIKLRTEEES